MSKKPTTPPPQHGKWEATLKNIRALKTRLTALERRVQRLERKG